MKIPCSDPEAHTWDRMMHLDAEDTVRCRECRAVVTTEGAIRNTMEHAPRFTEEILRDDWVEAALFKYGVERLGSYEAVYQTIKAQGGWQ